MAKFVEVNEERQGRPKSKQVVDLGKGTTVHAGGTPIYSSTVDDEPVSGATISPISSNWAYDYVKEQEEKDELNDLMTNYNTMMANERYTSNRRGYEIR